MEHVSLSSAPEWSFSCLDGLTTRDSCGKKSSFESRSFLFSFNSSWFEGNTVFALPDPPILVQKQFLLQDGVDTHMRSKWY